MNEIQLKYGVVYVIYADGQPRPLIVEAATLSKAAVYAQEKVRDMATARIMTGELAAEGVHYDILQVVRQGWEGKSVDAHATLTAQAKEGSE